MFERAKAIWAEVKFLIEHIKEITLAGMIWWMMLLLSAQILGLIDIEAQCPQCGSIFEHVIKSASAATTLPEPSTNAPMLIRVTVLPTR